MGNLESVRAFYRSGLGSPRELFAKLLERIAQDQFYNAWIHVATLADLEPYFQALQGKETSQLPLWGIPFAVKDNIDVAGMPTTAGCPDYSYMPPRNAPVVQKLIDAGAIPIGKTNMDQFATGLVGTRSPYGVVMHPTHKEYIAGGSSSGSAVALARRHCAFSLGTDTAGSGRVPAAFCGLVGVKPSAGMLSTEGVVPACKSLDCVSLFTRDLSDARMLFELLAPAQKPDPIWNEEILIPIDRQMQFFGDGTYHELWQNWVAALSMRTDIRIRRINIAPLLEAAKLLYQGPWIAERWAMLGSFVSSHPNSCLPLTQGILETGRMVTGAEVFQGMAQLEEFRTQAKALLGTNGILALPTAGAIFTQAQVAAEPLLRNQELGTYTNFMNLLKLCGLAIPAGHTPAGLPFGITLMGMAGHDKSLFQCAEYIQDQESTLIAVCGAHMRGLPLNHELLECGASFVRTDTTAPRYGLFALDTTPPKPGLVAQEEPGASIELEIWRIPFRQYGRFVSRIPAPLGIGRIILSHGEVVQGFLCESYAARKGRNISEYGGWRAFLEGKR